MEEKKQKKKIICNFKKKNQKRNAQKMNDKTMEMQLKKSIQEYEVGYKSLQNAIEYAIENKAPNYVQYINSVFVGDRVAKNIKVGDVTSCEAQCSTDKSCSGATFFPITSTCIHTQEMG